MQAIRSIVAMLIAVIIAIPACCCFASAAPAKAEQHSCCPGGKDKKQDKAACECVSVKKALTDTDKPLPAPVAMDLPPAVMTSLLDQALPVTEATAPVGVVMDTGPPLRRLAVLQRYLI